MTEGKHESRKIPNNKFSKTHLKIESKKDFQNRIARRTDNKGHSFDCTWMTQSTEQSELKRLVHEPRSSRALQRISFHLNGELRSSEIASRLKRMTESLKRWNSIPSVSITIDKGQFYEDFENHHMILVLNILKRFKALKRFELKLISCTNIEKGLCYIKKRLARHPLLECLNLTMDDCLSWNTKVFRSLTDGIKRLDRLKALDFNFPACPNVNDSGLEVFGRGLKTLPVDLRSLRLNFERCEKISDAGLYHLRDGVREHASLKHLGLYFEKCQISAAGMHAIRDVFVSLTLLQGVDFQCKWQNEITDLGVSEVAAGLKGLKFLENLTFGIPFCDKIGDLGLRSLSESLKKLSQLKSVVFDFTLLQNITDAGISSLNESLEQLKELELIHINFSQYMNSVSDAGLRSIGDTLQKLPLLKDIKLDFFGCYKISDVGLQGLSTAFQSMSSVQKFSLSVQRCNEITNKGFQDFCQNLKNLNQVQQLSLNFSNLDRINDSGLYSLGESLENLTLLKSVFLRLEYLRLPTMQGLERVIDGLKEIGSLEEVDLHTTGWKKVSDRAKGEMKKNTESMFPSKIKATIW